MSIELYLGWDIGGAHLKLSQIDIHGRVISVEQFPTPLWQGLDCLKTVLECIRQSLAQKNIFHAVTMTGELADIFPDRLAGVKGLVQLLSSSFPGHSIGVYTENGHFIPPSEIENYYLQVASANWHATGTYVAKQFDSGLLVDVGSTTTDIIPFCNNAPCHRGNTDQQRLQYDELIYTGFTRTPVMAVIDRVPYQGEWQSVAAEYFATMADVYRITGDLDENSDLLPAADNADKTRVGSIRRLARMLGRDLQTTDDYSTWHGVATFIAEQQMSMINMALFRVISTLIDVNHLQIIGAGAGRFIVKKLSLRHGYDYIDFSCIPDCKEQSHNKMGDCAAAVAVAQLARYHEIS